MIYLTTYVPYDPAVWQQFWNATMRTIGSSVGVGFIIFAALFVISVFKTIINYFR